MRRLPFMAIAAAALLTPRSAGAAGPGASPAQIARGARLVREAQCGRCHAVAALDLPSAPRAQSCSGCHEWIHGTRDDAEARAREARAYPDWDRYVHNVKSYLAVPDLAAAGARLDPAWVSRFVRAPYKVRPGFGESMIPVPLSAADADAVAAFLTRAARAPTGVAAEAAALPASFRPEDIAEGERLYAKLQCARCHAFGARPAQPGTPDAPDLAHTRQRMPAATIAAFIADPSAFTGGGEQHMPGYGLAAREAAQLRNFIIVAAPQPARGPAADAPPVLPPPLARRVTWEEVNSRVFAAVCAHCHSDGKLSDGDGGPGNTGGLGYAGVGLDLSSWEGLLRGASRPDGKRVSVLESAPGQELPPLLARLWGRVAEHTAERAGVAAPLRQPGMPLGQPPLDRARLQLVRAWLQQGAPGPSGQKAITRVVRPEAGRRGS